MSYLENYFSFHDEEIKLLKDALFESVASLSTLTCSYSACGVVEVMTGVSVAVERRPMRLASTTTTTTQKMNHRTTIKSPFLLSFLWSWRFKLRFRSFNLKPTKRFWRHDMWNDFWERGCFNCRAHQFVLSLIRIQVFPLYVLVNRFFSICAVCIRIFLHVCVFCDYTSTSCESK